MDLASRGPNSIPTVDSGHSPACIRQPWERRVPTTKKTRGGKKRMIIIWTQSNEMKANIFYLSEDSGRWTALIWAQTQFRDSMLQTARYSEWFGSIVFAPNSRNKERKSEWEGMERRKKERERSHSGGAREHSTRDVVKFHWCQINFSVIWEFN